MTPRQQKFFNALPPSWQQPLQEVCERPEIDNLIYFLQQREAAGATIYPSKNNIFAALHATPFQEVSVVIVGQDPYHQPGQAQGLSFSVPTGIPIPPSLRNIYKELHTDIGMPIPKTGCLTDWAEQGVLLLNALLTVEEGKPAAHAGQGWEIFTDAIIQQLLKRTRPTVFLLWGSYAQKKFQHLHTRIDPKRNLILKSAHPSPLSATKFFGCRHFSKANNFLQKHQLKIINWSKVT